jgi:hypothetical protein
VAGLFYPADERELRAAVRQYLHLAAEELRQQSPTVVESAKAVILPHAGYRYCGAVAARGYAALSAARAVVKRVVMVSPAHRVAFRGLAASSAEAFACPLGEVAVDREVIERLVAEFGYVQVNDEAHGPEHGLEVHLPFLCEVFGEGGVSIVPLLIGQSTMREVAGVIDWLWDGPETLMLISSDLSHYHSYGKAQEVDSVTAEAIIRGEPGRIGPEQACGHLAVQGLVMAAGRHGLTAVQLDLRNSGDTAGPRDEVVGYGAFLFT